MWEGEHSGRMYVRTRSRAGTHTCIHAYAHAHAHAHAHANAHVSDHADNPFAFHVRYGHEIYLAGFPKPKVELHAPEAGAGHRCLTSSRCPHRRAPGRNLGLPVGREAAISHLTHMSHNQNPVLKWSTQNHVKN